MRVLERSIGRDYVWPVLAAGLGIVLLSSFVAFQILRPLPTIPPTVLQPSRSVLGPTPSALPWPHTGLDQPGPLIPVTTDDVATFHREQADGQSVLPVAAGEQLTEYQALRALLVPSGN